MDTQNQNDVQPDYGFILNQGKDTSGAPQQNGSKKNKPKVALIVGGIFVFFLLVVAIVAASITSNVQQNGETATQDLVSNFINEVSRGDLDAANGSFSTVTGPVNDGGELSRVLTTWSERYDLQSCSVGEASASPTDTVDVQTPVTCTLKNSAEKDNFVFLVTLEDGKEKIITFRYVGKAVT